MQKEGNRNNARMIMCSNYNVSCCFVIVEDSLNEIWNLPIEVYRSQSMCCIIDAKSIQIDVLV